MTSTLQTRSTSRPVISIDARLIGVSDPEAQQKAKQALARWVKSWAQ